MANENNLIPVNLRAKDEQREIRSKGGKARAKKARERKTIAMALKAVLDEPITKGSKTTKLEGISIKVIKGIFDNPDIRDLKTLAEILGELKQTISTEGMTINITSSEKGKSNIEKLIGE